jgi:hypothetical protein
MTTRIVRLVVVASVLSLGFSAFVRPVGACGGSQGTGSCKEADQPALSLIARVRTLVSVFDVLIP